MWHGLLDVTLQSTWHEVILHGLREVTSSNFAWSILIVNGFNGPKWQEKHNIHYLYNKTIDDLCFRRHGVLLNSKLNHIDLRSAYVNMTFTVQ